jgi:hypothetical protein
MSVSAAPATSSAPAGESATASQGAGTSPSAASSGQQSQQAEGQSSGANGAGQVAAPAAEKQQVTSQEVGAWFDKALPTQGELDVNAYIKDGAPDLAAYHRAVQLRSRADSFRNGLSDVVLKPHTVSGVTIPGPTSEAEVSAFINYARQKTQGGLTPSDLYTLHRLNDIINGARSTGAKSTETAVQSATNDPKVIGPSGKAPATTAKRSELIDDTGRVKSSRDMFGSLFAGKDPKTDLLG